MFCSACTPIITFVANSRPRLDTGFDISDPSTSRIMSQPEGAWPYAVTYQTRWLDNDQYGHLNNSSYYLIADSIINAYLISACGLEPYIHASSSAHRAPSSDSEKPRAHIVGLVITNSCRYFASCSFPSPLTVALRVVKLGNSSVTYQVSIREQNATQTAALITSTHVFVDRHTRTPVTIPKSFRVPLSTLFVDTEEPRSKL